MSEDGAAVGESLGHQIGASYAKAYGGWNIEQTDISVQKLWSTTNQDWADFRASYNGQKYQEKIQENLEEITKLYGERIAAAQEQIALRQAEDDVKNEQAEANFAEARLHSQAQALHDGTADLRRQSMLLESEMERLDENLSDENVIEDAAREFLTDLGL